MTELESQLQENTHHRLKLIISDGVFSMDGNVTPLRSASVPTTCIDQHPPSMCTMSQWDGRLLCPECYGAM